MKRNRFFALVLISLLFGTTSACAPAQEDSPASLPDMQEQGLVITEPSESTEPPEPTNSPTPLTGERILAQIPAPSLSNNLIETETIQGIGIYLPPGYHDSEKRYPVLYFLPGFSDSYQTFITSLSGHMNTLLTEGIIDEMIVVTVTGMNRFGGGFYQNSPVTGNWEDFVTQDVVAYVDENYRTIQSAEARGLAGHSMGGFGVINIAMHTCDIFKYVYSMSPGLLDENGLDKTQLNFAYIEEFIEEVAEMDDEAAREAYAKYPLAWPENFTYGYGSAFTGDADARAPYIKLPEKDANGNYLHDDVWKLYNAGYGGLSEKLDAYQSNLLSLGGFVIDYGLSDEYVWIPEGCEYFSQQLHTRSIPHELISYDGTHGSMVMKRLKEEVLPYFSEAFCKGSDDSDKK